MEGKIRFTSRPRRFELHRERTTVSPLSLNYSQRGGGFLCICEPSRNANTRANANNTGNDGEMFKNVTLLTIFNQVEIIFYLGSIFLIILMKMQNRANNYAHVEKWNDAKVHRTCRNICRNIQATFCNIYYNIRRESIRTIT